jgi:hypothetical protein
MDATKRESVRNRALNIILARGLTEKREFFHAYEWRECCNGSVYLDILAHFFLQ